MNVTFRTPTRDDLDLCADMHTKLFFEAHKHVLQLDEGWQAQKRDSWIKFWESYIAVASVRSDYLVKVAFDHERPVGFVIVDRNFLPYPHLERGDLGALYLDTSYHGQGIGKRMLCMAMIHCERFLSSRMSVSVLADDEVAKKWYQRFGAEYISSGLTQDEHKAKIDHFVFRNLRSILKERFGQETQPKTLRDRIRRFFL